MTDPPPLLARFPEVLETSRLIIRPGHPDDAEAVNAAVRDSMEELRLWMPWADHVPPLEETLERLRQQREAYESGADCGLSLRERATGAFVGKCGVHLCPGEPLQREIGYWIRTSHTRRGYATEAVRAIAAAALEALHLEALQLKTSERNLASQRVAERAGFVRQAVLEDGRVDPGGIPSRTVLYVLARHSGSPPDVAR